MIDSNRGSVQDPQMRPVAGSGVKVRIPTAASMTLVFLAAIAILLVVEVSGLGGVRSQGASAATISDDGLSFATPSGWNVNQADLVLHYEKILEYVGTGSASIKCASDYVPGLGGTCTESADLVENTFVLKISSITYPPSAEGPVSAILDSNSQAALTSVGGANTAFEQLPAGNIGSTQTGTILRWTIARAEPGASYRIVAYLHGSDTTEMRAQISTWLDGITIESGR